LENNKQQSADVPGAQTADYETPQIDTLIHRDDLEREVHYAGPVISIPTR